MRELDHSVQVMEVLLSQAMQSDSLLCDVKFICDRGKGIVFAHQSVLLLAGEQLSDLVTSSEIVAGYRLVKLGSVSSYGLRSLLQFIYTGRFQITTEVSRSYSLYL